MENETLEYHPAADLFPLMGGEQLAELAADIREHGQRYPILIDGERRIVDGRNRYLACRAAGIEPRLETINGHEPLALSLGANLKRRNLTANQRAIVAARAWDLFAAKRGGKREAGQAAQSGPLARTRDRLADVFGVNKTAIDQARALLQRDPAAAEAVEAGATSLAEAFAELRKRELAAALEAERLAYLRAEDPILADRVAAGEIDLARALAILADAKERLRVARAAATRNLGEGLLMLDQPATAEHVAETRELFDPGLAVKPGQEVTAERLRRAAEFCSALADALEGEPDE